MANTNGTHKPTCEDENFSRKINPKCFGDRAKPTKVDEKLKKRKKQEIVDQEPFPKRKECKESVLTAKYEGLYKPKTKDTRKAYEELLGVIQKQLGGQPMDVVYGAADEILEFLKSDCAKKEVIEKILNCFVTKDVFDYMVLLGNLIVDYHDAIGDAFDDYDETMGVPVEFEEEVSDLDLVSEDDEEDGSMGEPMKMNDDVTDGNNDDLVTVCVHDIDGYWLQRKISEVYKQCIDPHQCRILAEEVLKILGSSCDGDEVESKLLVQFQFEKFSFVKFLLQNRLKIVWYTRLARAGDEEGRELIKDQMLGLGVPELDVILDQLYATRESSKDRLTNMERSTRETVQQLNGGSCGDDSNLEDADRLNGQCQLLDLENLSFDQGGPLVANKKCDLPPGSSRKREKGYEQIHVPAVRAKPLSPGEKLVKVSDIPEWGRPAFEGMARLNRVQSKVYDRAFFSNDNILLCAPTGAGKTNVAMLTILRQIGLHINSEGSINHNEYKIVYVAPMKALVAEMVSHLSDRLQHYGVIVRELSGDRSLTSQEVEGTQVIVTTPEKWDIITRKSGEHAYTQLVRLLIIDEIHLLHDNRGPVLESIVARTIRFSEKKNVSTRLVGLSATLPNYDDVARFLHVNVDKGLFYFDNSYRPCPLSQTYIGISAKKHQGFHLMNSICYEKVADVAGKHQVLIFVHSRKETVRTVRYIRDMAITNNTLCRFLKEDSVSHEILHSDVQLVKSSDLKEILPYGFAIHHAGMARSDRQLVEDLFRDGHVQVLVSTSTLAWGVNLPAHMVIIKGTRIYNPEKGAWTELSILDVMQMMGRAGRPQYDTYGEGIIITGHSELQYYLSLMNQQLPIESQFISKLADHLNAEIVLGTIQDAREACEWLGYTYLYVRMLKNPTLYGLAPEGLAKDMSLCKRRSDLIHSAATLLEKNGLIKYDRRSQFFQVTDMGRIASYYYITHGTISTFSEHLKPTMGDIELCRLFSVSEEFKYITVSQDEKIELAKLSNRVPIVIKESMEEPSAKINVLLQAYISRPKLEGLSLMSDMAYITQSAGRILRALFEIILKRGWAQLAEKALNLCKMVNKRMWNVQTPLRQFRNIPNEILLKMEKKDITWESYYYLSSHELGELIRYPTMGNTLHKCIHQIPKLNLAANIQPISHTLLRIELTITPDFQWQDKVHGFVEPFWIIVEDSEGEHILHHEYFLLKKQYSSEDHIIDFTVPIYEPKPPQYFIRVVSDQWVGSQSVLPVLFKHLILPEKNLPPSELLDLKPLPVTELKNPSYEALYSECQHFNTVQTQVFSALYRTDDNVLVAAPAGNRKTICAEFAILRNHQKCPGNIMRCVYVAPVQSLAKERFNDWRTKFGDGLGITVVELTGETATDLKFLEKGQLIVSTPEKWDALSRRWKQRKHIREVSLFIVDDLHLMCSRDGAVLEVVVSRMKFISSLVENQIRIVALSSSVANANDISNWIGASLHGHFNFPPGVRSVPIEINIQGIDIANFESRRQAMLEPTLSTISKSMLNCKPAIVFVPTRKHTRLTALDLMVRLIANNEEKPDSLLQSKENVELFVSQIEEPTLRKTLEYGVGYLHEGSSSIDRVMVKKLFECGWVQVCVVSRSMCWEIPFYAPLVVVMGTQYYDSWQNSRSDYAVSDLLQMVGHAGRTLVDSSAKCVIFCDTAHKEYYKKFLYEAIPVESHLQYLLHDSLNAEIAAGVVGNKQQAVDYLTWTFMYRRLTKNPNYYNLIGVTHGYISEHLSMLVDDTIGDLEASQCVHLENNRELSSSNLGMISSYYYVSYMTVEGFNSSLTSKTKMKGLLGALALASEYARLPMRQGEEDLIRKLVNHQRFLLDDTPEYRNPHVKANALLQAHFSRKPVGGYLASDQRDVLVSTNRLVRAMVDVISSKGWLTLALIVMEVSQMVAQGMWERDPVLLQLPHFTQVLAEKCQERGIETVFDFMEIEDDDRRKLLQISDTELVDIVQYFERYPNIDLSFEVVRSECVVVTLERVLLKEGSEVEPKEGWWVVIGDSETDKLFSIKKCMLSQRKTIVNLALDVPLECGKNYKLYFMSDSYIGCDQEYSFTTKEVGALQDDSQKV